MTQNPVYLHEVAEVLRPLESFSEDRCKWILGNIPPYPEKTAALASIDSWKKNKSERYCECPVWTPKDEKNNSRRREALTAGSENTFVCFDLHADSTVNHINVMSVLNYLFRGEKLAFPLSRMANYIGLKHSFLGANFQFMDDYYDGPMPTKIHSEGRVIMIQDVKDSRPELAASDQKTPHYRGGQDFGYDIKILPKAVQAATRCAKELTDLLISEENKLCKQLRINREEMLQKIRENRRG